MKLFIKLAWRNVWRNKLRSTVIITALTLGICAGVFSSAFFKGLAIQRIDKVIKTEISHIQIHLPEYRQANDISKFIPNANSVASKISEFLARSIPMASRLAMYWSITSCFPTSRFPRLPLKTIWIMAPWL